MEPLNPRQATPKGAPTTGRKRGSACERCNRLRTRCDGWIIGVPCTGCRKSNNHAHCALIQSKRRRGPDGRYTFGGTDGEPSRRGSTTTANPEPPTPARSSHAPSTTSTHQRQDGESASSVAGSSQTGHDDGQGPSEEQPSRTLALEKRPQRTPLPKQTRSQSSVQPSFVGESWYASYVMRGYAPGHTSFHRPIDDCDRAVQSVTRDAQKQDSPNKPLPPGERANSPDLPSPALIDRLIEAYFERFHAFCPILQKNVFFESFHNGTISGTLLRSVLFVASLHCDLEIVHLMGYSSRFDANNDLFTKASASFDEDHESSRTNMVLSSYMLHYWFGNPTTYRDAYWWLAAAIRSAQCMGYHRSTKNSQMPPEEKSRWKRIWWCLYIRDRQAALSTGTPMVINDLDHDVEDLVAEDLPGESPETVQYIISQMELNKAAARLYFLHCSPSRLPLSKDPSVRQSAMQDIQETLRTWYATSQSLEFFHSHHHLSLIARTCYYYYLINLHQRLQRQSNKSEETKLVVDAALSVFSLVDDSLLYYTPEHFPMIYVSALFSAMTSLAANGSSSPPRSDELLRKIRPGLLALKQFEPVYILARWIRNFFMNIIDRSKSRSGEITPPTREVMETTQQTEGQPITPDSVPYASDQNAVVCTTTPMSANHPDSSTPSMMVDDPTFMFGDDCPPPELVREVGGFWPTSLTDGFMSNNPNNEMMDFPQPDSLQYQALYFLADLGIAGSEYV